VDRTVRESRCARRGSAPGERVRDGFATAELYRRNARVRRALFVNRGVEREVRASGCGSWQPRSARANGPVAIQGESVSARPENRGRAPRSHRSPRASRQPRSARPVSEQTSPRAVARTEVLRRCQRVSPRIGISATRWACSPGACRRSPAW